VDLDGVPVARADSDLEGLQHLFILEHNYHEKKRKRMGGRE
jgi:hypothetical protein